MRPCPFSCLGISGVDAELSLPAFSDPRRRPYLQPVCVVLRHPRAGSALAIFSSVFSSLIWQAVFFSRAGVASSPHVYSIHTPWERWLPLCPSLGGARPNMAQAQHPAPCAGSDHSEIKCSVPCIGWVRTCLCFSPFLALPECSSCWPAAA